MSYKKIDFSISLTQREGLTLTVNGCVQAFALGASDFGTKC